MDFKADVMVFSEAAHVDFGSTPAAEDLRVRALSHSSGCIHRLKRGKLTEIAMKIPPSCEAMTHLYFYPAHTELYLCDDYAFINRIRNRALFRVRFPHSGYYALKIYARPRHSEGLWPNVFNYIIEVLEPDDTALPFPIPVECHDLQGGFELREPEVRFLPSHSKVFFNLWVPGAKSVLVINEGKRTELVRDGGPSDTWTADVATNSPGSQLRVAAQFHEEEEAKLLTILLIYEVVHLEVKKEDVESAAATSSRQESPKTDQLEPETLTRSGQQGMNAEDGERSLTKSPLRSVINGEMEEESNGKTQKIIPIEEDERMRKMTRQKERDNVRAELLESIRFRKLDRLQESISTVHRLRLSTELEEELEMARSTIEGLQRLENLRDAILLLDGPALAEVHRNNPPLHPHLHDVMISVLLLLGHEEGQTTKWSNCQKLLKTLGLIGLKQSIEEFDLESVHPEILERAWQIIQDINASDVAQMSQGVSSFYSWVVGLYKEYSETHRNGRTPEPANRRRQREILSNRPS